MSEKINNILRIIDQQLAEEDMVLDSLKQAVENNWIDQDEADEQIRVHHEYLHNRFNAVD
jgi:hypothetical protein